MRQRDYWASPVPGYSPLYLASYDKIGEEDTKIEYPIAPELIPGGTPDRIQRTEVLQEL